MALPSNPETVVMAAESIINYQHTLHEERKRLLSLWVSEVEPIEVWDSCGMRLRGLTAPGHRCTDRFFDPCPVIIKSKWS